MHSRSADSADPAEAPVDRALEVSRVPIDSLHLDPANARTHPERNLAAIGASLTRFGQQKPIVVDKRGVVRAGNGTLTAAKALGWTHIDVVVTDLEGSDATAFSIADNRTAELAEWEEGTLAKLLDGLDIPLDELGFDQGEMDRLLAGLIPDALGGIVQDEVPLPADAATTRPADLWLLGRHRLLCGDSASDTDVNRLVAGAPIHLVHTDMPYNVKVEPRSNNAIAAGLSSFGPLHHQALDLARFPGKSKPTDAKLRAKDRPLQNDFVSDEEFARLLRAWFGNLSRVLLPGRAFYAWGGYANCSNYPSAIAEAGLYFSQSIIWDKQHPVLTRKDFMGAHEWCFYGWKLGAAHQYLGPANATDLWAVKKVNPQSMVHLTEKPVELAARAIQYSSREGENVIDLFGGSGSTLAAAEQTGRNAYLMEIDPLYCDVIVERWQKLAGQEARLEASGENYAQRKAASTQEVDDGPQAG
jgi:DNA modification methylase